MTTVRTTLRAALLLGAASAAPAAFAQDAAPTGGAAAGVADAGQLEEIVVTARKRAESLQDVPVAVSAFTEADIKEARIERLADVAKLTPGLNFTPLFGAQNQLPIIRGAAQTFGALNVGVFLDGVYLSGKAGVDIELNDLERIEVIKGPQSALYGRNTFAGAINYITQRPTAEWTGRAEGTIGDHGLRQVQASISGPLADVVRIRVGGYYREFDGFYRSGIDGGRVDFAERYGGILTLEVAPSTDFTATFRLSASKEDVGQPPSNVIRTNSAPARPAGSPVGTVRNLLYVGDVPAIPRNGVTVDTAGPAIVGAVLGGIPVIGPYGQRQDTVRGSLKLEWNIGGATLTSITAYDLRNTEYTFDGDNTICDQANGCPNFGAPFVPNIPQGRSSFALSSFDGSARDVSQELRLQSDNDGAFNWLIGGFLYDNRSEGIDRSVLGGGGANQGLFLAAGVNGYGFPFQVNTTKARSVFGSVTVRPSDAFEITGELRYEAEDQRFTQRPANTNVAPNAPGNTSARTFDLTRSFDFVTPRVTAKFNPSDDVMIYASVARGAKTGGINSNISILDSQRFYDPETTWNYEVGVKSDLLDRRLRLNLSGFYTDWRDQQVACQNPITAVPAGAPTGTTQRTYVCNVGEARIFGLEASATARFGEFFTLAGNYTYLNAEYERFVDDSLAATLATAGLPPFDFRGRKLPYVPKHKIVVSPQFNAPLSGDWIATARVDVSHQSRSFVRADNLQSFAPKTVVDLRLGVGDERLGVQVFVNNLFDDDTPVAAVRFFDSTNFSVSSPLVTGADRRQVGVTLRAGF